MNLESINGLDIEDLSSSLLSFKKLFSVVTDTMTSCSNGSEIHRDEAIPPISGREEEKQDDKEGRM